MKIGFVSDIHEDFESLNAAFTGFGKANCDVIVCLGDIVGFTLPFQRHIARRDANACLELIQDQCTIAVAGNHDLYAVRQVPKYTAGFPYGDDWYALDYELRARRSRNRIWLYEDSELPVRLTGRSTEYLLSLPEFTTYSFGGLRFFFSHFHYPDLSGSTIDTPRSHKQLARHFQFLSEHHCTMSFSGHGHPEGYARCDGKVLAFHGFGSAVLDTEKQWVVCPCTANTIRKNGYLVFDTDTLQLDAIPLGSRKTIV